MSPVPFAVSTGLLGDVAAPLTWGRLGATQIDFASVLIAAGGLLYGLGVWRLGRRRDEPAWSTKRTVAFFGCAFR